MFIKLGEDFSFAHSDIHPAASVLNDQEINERFLKFAKELKKVAPKADDFIYFSTRYITAAEANTINADGTPKLDRDGKAVVASWEKKGDTLKWVCSDASIEPYSNNNGDIFPEEELVKAHKLWVGRPLCLDHKSSSVDAVRGIILDSHYDRKHKYAVALIALDKITYPDLARKVSTGYSTSVSMGTGVSLAHCSLCGKGAKSEREFCQHMRMKQAKEINIGLNPIEISLVTNPADPTAKLRMVFAAAQNLKTRKYSSDTAEKVQELEIDLKEATDKLSQLKDIIDQDQSAETPTIIEPPYGQSSGDYAQSENETNTQNFSTSVPARYADINALFSELQILKSSFQQALEKLNQQKEENMSDRDTMNKEGYFQGGGGVNEPTPGKPKYPKDPLNEQLREKEDKQMVGQSPFPGVGSVDGMHPSPASVQVKDELKRKEMIQRAEDERDMRRKEALERAKTNLKEGYWRGGGGVNEPTPGKPKYPKDPLNEQLREKEDKQMVGQKPFPGVGNVDGLHPSPESVDEKDELKRKEMLARASLVARFVRAANVNGTDDLDNSGWQIFAKTGNGEKLVFSTTVKDISGNRSAALFDVIATKDFGTKMLDKIRAVGLEKAASIYKQSQAVAEMGAQPGLPQDAGGPSPAPAMSAAPPAMDAAPPAEDTGADGDPKESALKLAEKVRDDASDLLEAVRALTGTQAEMGELEEGIQALPQTQASQLEPQVRMRRDVHSMLVSAAKKSLAELKGHYNELKLISEVADSKSVKEASIKDMVETAFEQAETATVEAEGVLLSVAKYFDGVANLKERVKEAEEAASDAASEDTNSVDDSETDENAVFDAPMTDALNADDLNLHDFEEELSAGDDLEGLGDTEVGDDLENPEMGGEDTDLPDFNPEIHEEEQMADDVNDMQNGGTLVELAPGQPVPPGAKPVEPKQANLNTKEGRAAFRAKLAKDLGESEDVSKLKWNPMLDEADRLADGQTQLDTKPSGDLGKVETLPEVQKRMMEVAKAPPKVRKEAERLNDLIKAGAVDKDNLDQLVAEGLDSEVVKYWRDFYGQVDGGSEFAKLLTTETMKAKAEEEVATYKIKLARSYELANDMVRRGLLNDDRDAIGRQVEESMKWNDEAFESMKRVIAKSNVSIKKEASLPQVGLIGSGDPYTLNNQESDLQSELDRAFSTRRY